MKQSFLSENFQFLEVKSAIYLNYACFRNEGELEEEMIMQKQKKY